MPKIETILVATPMSDAKKEKLESVAPACRFIFDDPETFAVNPDAAKILQQADIIIGNPDPKKIPELHRLQWLQLFTAGANNYVESGVFPDHVLLTNASGAYGLAISEHMLGMLLSLQKKLHLYRDNQHQGLWRDEGAVTSIEDAHTLVIGLGDIGGEFARKMKALGSYTVGMKRHQSPCPKYLDELHLSDQLDALLPQADIIALALPENRDTRKLLDRRRLGLLKENAIILNVGRGSAIDTTALIDQLQSGKLGGAALDVTDPEPLPADHPLWQMANVLITPHISGGFHMPQTEDRIADIAIENLQRFLKGQPLINVIDFKTGYRTFRP